MKVLDTLDKFIDETPPTEQPQRFGNKAYRDWFSRMSEVSDLRNFVHFDSNSISKLYGTDVYIL